MGSSRQGSAPGRATIQGPRPAPLKGKKDSGSIRKPPVPPPTQRRSPLIIYVKSPKIIHTKARDFMALVQRLIGKSSTPPPPSSSQSPPWWPSSSAPAIAAMMPQAPSSSCFARKASQEMSLNVDAFLGDYVVMDAKPYQMLPPGAILTAPPSTPQNLHFSSSPKTYPNLLEISSPMILSPPNSQESDPFSWQKYPCKDHVRPFP